MFVMNTLRTLVDKISAEFQQIEPVSEPEVSSGDYYIGFEELSLDLQKEAREMAERGRQGCLITPKFDVFCVEADTVIPPAE